MIKSPKMLKYHYKKRKSLITMMYVISEGGENMEHITDEEIMFYILNID